MTGVKSTKLYDSGVLRAANGNKRYNFGLYLNENHQNGKRELVWAQHKYDKIKNGDDKIKQQRTIILRKASDVDRACNLIDHWNIGFALKDRLKYRLSELWISHQL